ncbi:Beta-hexosaminidase [Tritrichomonas foetus]|uniref:beta-N-acetylhexosaminidase n=1 Tax=Tritrichomonas foetus TaxID=1144522 RepID=A0A1J4K2V5_9EUKA|nr:Beta-hexosaminidase [Tritrichomonas foetus]|eukprot:OHT05298.1 Beta-hexosaminidase [Tritrichomonas foetus]
MLAFLFFASALSGEPLIIPAPVRMTVQDGYWVLSEKDKIYYDSSVPGAQEVANFCAEQLRKVTGYTLPLTTTEQTTGILFMNSDSEYSEEEYDFVSTNNCVKIRSSKRTGLFYGYQTLLQLLPVDVFCDTIQYTIWRAPCVEIHDYPRLQWRGILVDVARHWFDIPTVKTIIDGMAISKLNTIHMHLTDDQAWRLEIKKYPLLVEIGSVREQSPKMWDRDSLDGQQYGPYWMSQDEARELVAYAKMRGVTIVPEIEMPGHALSALSGYPQFSCTGGPFKPRCVWGVEDDVYCAGNDATLSFLEDILDEVLQVFDSSFIHCGGDECPKVRWQNCAKCQQRIKDQGLSDENQLQTWFVQHFANYLQNKGRRLIGWDEILEGGLAEGAAVMSWRGVDGGQAAARLGHDVVMTPAYYLYFDYYQFPVQEQYEYNCLLVTLNRIYMYDARSGIDVDKQKHIIGVQGNAWAEFTWTRQELQYKIFPRSCAVAETGWTQPDRKDWARFARNLELGQLERLRRLGLNVAPLSPQPNALWGRGEIPTKWITMTWPVTGALEQKGSYGVIFMYTEGENKLKVRNVKLLINNAVVGTDSHEGEAFDPPTSNTYSFYLSSDPAPGSKIEITAEVMTVDGTDSNGKVFIYAQ